MLVIAPTREIAVQIQQVVEGIGSAIEGLKCYTFIGGLSLKQDIANLQRCHIAIGTPGSCDLRIISGRVWFTYLIKYTLGARLPLC